MNDVFEVTNRWQFDVATVHGQTAHSFEAYKLSVIIWVHPFPHKKGKEIPNKSGCALQPTKSQKASVCVTTNGDNAISQTDAGAVGTSQRRHKN